MQEQRIGVGRCSRNAALQCNVTMRSRCFSVVALRSRCYSAVALWCNGTLRSRYCGVVALWCNATPCWARSSRVFKLFLYVIERGKQKEGRVFKPGLVLFFQAGLLSFDLRPVGQQRYKNLSSLQRAATPTPSSEQQHQRPPAPPSNSDNNNSQNSNSNNNSRIFKQT
jgi:hypothetical protein